MAKNEKPGSDNEFVMVNGEQRLILTNGVKEQFCTQKILDKLSQDAKLALNDILV